MKPNESMDQLIETKLTKSEAIDLLVEEMRDEIEKERTAISGEDRTIRDSLKHEDFAAALRTAKITVELPSTYRESFEVSIRFSGQLGKFPIDTQHKLSRLQELHKRQEELGKRIHELSDTKGRVRNTILKTMLEGTEQGKKFLELLSGLRLKVTPKLAARAQKQLSQ
jgi:hypothetical protein